MNATKIRKPVNALTVDDFTRYPVWEFALDEEDVEGQDETTVRPFSFQSPLDSSLSTFVIKASMVLADGTKMDGYLTPAVQNDSDLSSVQPIILAPEGQVAFWCGIMAPEAKEIATNYSLLRKNSPADVFPISFESVVEVVGGPVRGTIPGFLVLEDFRTRHVRVVA